MEKDFNKLTKQSDKKETALNKALLKNYQTALKEIKKKMSTEFEKYSADGVLTYNEMMKYNRLARLENEIKKEINELYKKNGQDIKLQLTEILEDNYYKIGFFIEKDLKIDLNYTLLDKEAIKIILDNNISGQPYKDRLLNSKNQMYFKAKEQLTQGLILGESYPEMTKRLNQVFQGDIKRTYRIVRTESNRIRNESRLKAYEKAEVEGVKGVKVWVATLDSRTRDSHRKLDGQEADKDGYFNFNGRKTKAPSGFGVPELDINCRCTTRIEFKDLEPEERRARNVNNKGVIIPYTNYAKWKNNLK